MIIEAGVKPLLVKSASVAACTRYFPSARVYAVDIARAEDRASRERSGALRRLKAKQRAAGCEHDEDVWDERTTLTTDTDATREEELARAGASLPDVWRAVVQRLRAPATIALRRPPLQSALASLMALPNARAHARALERVESLELLHEELRVLRNKTSTCGRTCFR